MVLPPLVFPEEINKERERRELRKEKRFMKEKKRKERCLLKYELICQPFNIQKMWTF
jgi:hypothetical protein